MPKGFDGAMYAFGKHVYQYASHDTPVSEQYHMYTGTDWLIPDLTSLSKSLSHLLSNYFHWETRAMSRTLEIFDELPPDFLGGNNGLTKSMNASVNLVNPAHYDANDLGVGISVWMENVHKHPSDSYFILPNLIVKDNNEKQGRDYLSSFVMVVQYHGMDLCYDTVL